MCNKEPANLHLPLCCRKIKWKKKLCHSRQLGRGIDLSCCLQKALTKHTFHLLCGRGIQDDLSLSLLGLLTYTPYFFLSTHLSTKQPTREFMGVCFILVLWNWNDYVDYDNIDSNKVFPSGCYWLFSFHILSCLVIITMWRGDFISSLLPLGQWGGRASVKVDDCESSTVNILYLLQTILGSAIHVLKDLKKCSWLFWLFVCVCGCPPASK